MDAMIGLILAWVYTVGAALFIGAQIADVHFDFKDLLAILAWPVALPSRRFLHWWQWSKCGRHKPLARYLNTPWWSRGEPRRPIHRGDAE